MIFPPSSLDPGSPEDREFGCRPKLVSQPPQDATFDGCEDPCTTGDEGCPSGGGDSCIGEDRGGNVGSTERGGPIKVNPCIETPWGAGMISGTRGAGQWKSKTCAGCFCGFTPSIGNKVVQLGAPGNGAQSPHLLLTYNSRSTESTHYGMGFSNSNARWIEEIDSTTVELHRGDGRVFLYGNKDVNGVYTPPPQADSKIQNQWRYLD